MEGFNVFKEGENEKDLKKLVKDTFAGEYGGYDDNHIRKIELLKKNPSERADFLKLDNLEKTIKELWSKIKILKEINALEANKILLNKKNFELHNTEFSPSNSPKNEIEIALDQINVKIFFLTKKAQEEKVTLEQLDELQKKYDVLNSEYEDLLNKVDPSLN